MKDNNLIYVAYAEDHPITRNGIPTFLHPLGRVHVGILAENGQDLIEKIEKAEYLPDVCILDVDMPVLNGFQAQQQISKRWPGIKTLVFTCYPQGAFVYRMIQYGANGYLPKGSDPEEIHKAIIAIHDYGYYYSSLADSKLFNQVLNNEPKFPTLTDMELDVLRLSCSELTYIEIAEKLNTSDHSVKGCRNRMFNKFNVSSRIGLVMYAVKTGIISLSESDDQVE